ncbi:hypothetical protein JCM10450v2_005060 [Rhodotorula kratochvilovae]
MHAVRSFLLVALLSLISSAAARTDPLHPALHGGHLSRPSVHRPLSRSPRALLRARQAIALPPPQAVAARRAADDAARVQGLERVRRAVGVVGEEVGRRAERVRRSAGGAWEGVTAREEGQALHDILFRLLQILSSSSDFNSPSSIVPLYAADAPVVALAARPAAALAAVGARPSASPHPPAAPDPPAALRTLLALLSSRIASPLAEVLPALPPAERDALRALLAEMGDEVRVLAASAGGQVHFGAEADGGEVDLEMQLEGLMARMGGNGTRV